MIRIKDGVLHGVLAQKDIDDKIVPLVANLLTDMINKDPMSDTAKTIIGLFENQNDAVTKKKCMDNAKDCCKTNRRLARSCRRKSKLGSRRRAELGRPGLRRQRQLGAGGWWQEVQRHVGGHRLHWRFGQVLGCSPDVLRSHAVFRVAGRRALEGVMPSGAFDFGRLVSEEGERR